MAPMKIRAVLSADGQRVRALRRKKRSIRRIHVLQIDVGVF